MKRISYSLILVILFLAYLFYTLQRRRAEGFKDIDDDLLVILNKVSSGLPDGALCLNGDQCLSGVCQSSLTGLKFSGQDASKKNIPLARYGNCVKK
jgi:hypothetical protein